MSVHDVQSSFAGGEISPAASARVDLQKYKISCRTLRNFIPGPHGEAYNRPGTQYVATAKFSNKKSRLVSFVAANDSAYVLEFGHQYVRFFKDGAPILEDAYNATVPAWASTNSYRLNDYVLASGSDGGGVFSTHLFKSLNPFNIGVMPLSSPTYWQDLGHLPIWGVGTTYGAGDHVSEIRTADGKSKTFVSLVGSNLGNDPLNPTAPWNPITPTYSAATTYAANDLVVAAVGNDHYMFKSIQNANTNHDPITSPAWWDINQPALWFSNVTYALNDYVQYNSDYLGNYPAWDVAATYGLNDHATTLVTSTVGGNLVITQKLWRSNLASNHANDPNNPQTWWGYASLPWWANGTTYAINASVIVGVFSGGLMSWYRYKSLQNGNSNHDPSVSPTWWVLDQPATWNAGTTYGLSDYVQAWNGGRWILYQSGLASNLDHDPVQSIASWTDETPSGPFRIYKSGIASNLNHNPKDPYSGPSWQEVISPGAYEVATPYTEDDIANLKCTQSADTLYIAHNTYAPRTLARSSDTSWTMAVYPFVNGPFMFPNTNTAFGMGVSYSVGVYQLFTVGGYDYFDAGMVGTLFKLLHVIPGQTAASDFSATGNSSNIVLGGVGTWRFVTTGTWTGTVLIEQSTDGGSTWATVKTYRASNDANYNTFGTIDNGDEYFLIRVRASALTSGTCHASLYSDGFQFNELVKMTAYVDLRHATVTPIKNVWSATEVGLYGGDNVSYEWSEGSWSDYRGWPGAVSFCQDRLIWGGTKTEPQTEWMTKTSNYVDFNRSDPLVDSDGITVNLTGRQLNPIKALLSFLNAIVAFTSGSEHSTISGNGPLAPASVETKMQGSRGCNGIQPLVIGQRILFVQPSSSSVREMIYQFYTDVFESQNISQISDHLFKGYSIVDMAYQQEPDSLVWFVRSDGSLIGLTYIVEQEMLAWSRHDTLGAFEAITTIPGSAGNEAWFIVNRNNRRYVERLTARTTSTATADQYFVDCGISYSGAPASSLSGYDHLNGLLVAINAGGFVKQQQVVSGGMVDLDGTYSQAHVGLPYVSDLETLNPEIPLRDGTLQDRKYQIARASVRFLNTVGGSVGSDLDHLDDLALAANPAQRDLSLSDSTPTPLFTGIQTLPMQRNDDQRGHVAIRQSDPMPMTVLAVTSSIEPGENP